MKIVKDHNNNIISGTEVAYQKHQDKATREETPKKDFQSKWKEHKIKYLKDHSTKEMVYENGSALAFVYKELQRLNTLLISNLQTDDKKED